MLALGVLLTFNLWSFAQPGEPSGFIVSDLQLISTTSRPDWGDHWTAPVEAATILAWFHDHGYPRLLEDLNDDGVIDELDTIELSDILGKGSMKTNSPHGTTDALLVFGLASYVAEKYPNEFELKIYDPGFPAEYEREFGGVFTPDVIPGILLTPKSEPSFSAYTQELQDEEGVIVAIEEEPDHNYYFAGRSFQFEPIAENTYAVDLAWAEEDWYEPGTQGKVLETRVKQTDALYLDYQHSWAKVECMLALSPSVTAGEGIPGEDCPDLIVIGSAMCEFVKGKTESDDKWDITVKATVMNIGTANVPGPFHLLLGNISCEGVAILLAQEVLLCGAEIDQINTTGSKTVLFEFSLPATIGPEPCCKYTLIVDSHAEIDESCYPAPWGEFNNAYHGTVCCDGEPRVCPDLTIQGIHSCRCWKTDTGHICRVYIEATITNIAPGIPVSVPFGVGLLYGCTDGGGPHSIGKVISGTKLAELNATGSTSVGFWYVFVTTDPVPPCCRYVLVVDYWNAVDESCHPHPAGEHNNFFAARFCCKTPPEDGRCPDLTVSGKHTCVCRETPEGVLVCDVDIYAFVGKDGGPVSDPFEVRLTIDCDDAFPSQEQWKMVAPGQINDGFEMVHFDYSFIPLDPTNPCCTYSLEVDQPDVIDETCFIGGEMNNAFGPDEFCCGSTSQDCPDLVISVAEAICTCKPGTFAAAPLTGVCTVTVYATVTNIGEPVPAPFDVALKYSCDDETGNLLVYRIEGSQLVELNDTGSTTVKFTWPFIPLGEDLNCCGFALLVDSAEEIDECPPHGEENNTASGMVCCEVPLQECPDLAITGEAICQCGYDLPNVPRYGCIVTVEATVTNIGTGNVPGQFYVGLQEITCNGTPIAGGEQLITVDQLAELNSSGSTTTPIIFTWLIPATGPDDLPCCTYTLLVDSTYQIAECPLPEAEENNTYVGRVCCEDTTPPCPDLVIDVTRSSCSCSWTPQQELACTVNVYATVENIGTQTATHFYCKLQSTEGGDQILIASLAPNASRALHFSFTFTAPAGKPVPCPLDFDVIADSKGYVDECDEDNNLDSGSVCCRR
jgi:hypothetical protein